ncbi:predicted protein [Coccidioides posadasii str. Silveira]|uniref:Predicted protein n=1 Tax=Coccidioides posadasii (strain RMSCC 757 / Silveira) TaxID=443226 RepID=E9CZC4_COCPS|nr:predicted protein [Coccidioides posadasii str. Silveira]
MDVEAAGMVATYPRLCRLMEAERRVRQHRELASTKDIMIEHQLERLEFCVGNLLIKVIKRTFKGPASTHRLSQPAKWQRSK